MALKFLILAAVLFAGVLCASEKKEKLETAAGGYLGYGLGSYYGGYGLGYPGYGYGLGLGYGGYGLGYGGHGLGYGYRFAYPAYGYGYGGYY